MKVGKLAVCLLVLSCREGSESPDVSVEGLGPSQTQDSGTPTPSVPQAPSPGTSGNDGGTLAPQPGTAPHADAGSSDPVDGGDASGSDGGVEPPFPPTPPEVLPTMADVPSPYSGPQTYDKRMGCWRDVDPAKEDPRQPYPMVKLLFGADPEATTCRVEPSDGTMKIAAVSPPPPDAHCEVLVEEGVWAGRWVFYGRLESPQATVIFYKNGVRYDGVNNYPTLYELDECRVSTDDGTIVGDTE